MIRRPGERGGIVFGFLVLVFLAALAAGMYLLRHPLLREAGDFWIIEDPLSRADAIVVIGDDDLNGDRAARAADLFRRGLAPVVVASGRRLRPYASEAELIERDLENRGVPSSAVVRFDHTAADTREEAVALRGLIDQRKWRSIIVVTSNYHTRRAQMIFRKVLPKTVAVWVASAPDPAYDPDDWWEQRSGLKLFFMESVGYPVAVWELHGAPGTN